jgi:hypothetical protein
VKVEHTKRAVADLRKISADSYSAFGDQVAGALEARVRAVIDGPPAVAGAGLKVAKVSEEQIDA